MRAVQLAAVALLIVGAAAASFTIWQIIGPAAAGTKLSGPAPVLIGNAPPPATSTPQPTAKDQSTPVTIETTAQTGPTATPIARNLAPATPPEPTGEPAESGSEPTPPIAGAARSASRQLEDRNPEPASLRIPRIGIEAPIVPVGYNERGEMASPDGYFDVGWWRYGAAPGDYGKAVLAGHVDSPDGKAIFYDLDRLEPGDEIFVASQESNEDLRFIVTGAALYHIDHAPVDQIFGPSTTQELILITCGGTFDRSSGSYLYRRVVFARLAQ